MGIEEEIKLKEMVGTQNNPDPTTKGCGKMFHFEDEKLGIIHLKCGIWIEVKPNWEKMEYCEECVKDNNEVQNGDN